MFLPYFVKNRKMFYLQNVKNRKMFPIIGEWRMVNKHVI